MASISFCWLRLIIVFAETHTEGKYPILDEHWQSTVPDLYVIGTAMQARDRQAASGFIHGIRYNVRTLTNMLRNTYDGFELKKEVFSPIDQEEICNWVISKSNLPMNYFPPNQMDNVKWLKIVFHCF